MKVAELIKRDFPGLAASPELLQEIANELGSSREVISRLLKKLEKNKKVSLAQKEIKIL